VALAMHSDQETIYIELGKLARLDVRAEEYTKTSTYCSAKFC